MICLICTSCIRIDLVPALPNEKKETKNTVRKTIASVSLNGRQPSVSGTWARTERPSSRWREKTRRYGGCGRSEAVTEHKDILIRPSAGSIQTTTSSREMMFLPCEVSVGGGSAHQPPSPQRVLHPNANFQLCFLCAHGNPVFFLFGQHL